MSHLLPPSSANKYRPYFSAAELAEIIRCVKAASTSLPLITYLETFAMKIERSVITPQLSLQPSLEQKLGMSVGGGSHIPALPGPNPPTAAELFAIWKSNPEYLHPKQLAAVHQYRWEAGLMDSEEAERYEDSVLSGSGS